MEQLKGPWTTWPTPAKRRLLKSLQERKVQTQAEAEAAAAIPTFDRFQDDPAGFGSEVLGSVYTSDQVRILESVRDYRITVVPSANGVGKTFVGGDAALWWHQSFVPSKVRLTAAPPEENLETLLWGEVSRAFRMRPDLLPPGGLRRLRVDRTDEWWLRGRSIPQSADKMSRQARFSGLHSIHLLHIIDEGDAVPPEIYRAIESCMSGEHDRLLILLNPRNPSGYVWNLIRAGLANVIHLSAFNHPNVISGENRIPGAVTRERTVERILLWSRVLVADEERDPERDDSLFVVPEFLEGETASRPDGYTYPPLIGGQVRKITNPALAYMVLGIYPTAMANALFDRHWIRAARDRWLAWQGLHGDVPPKGVQPRSGQDVAEMGDDLNALVNRFAGWVAPIEVWAKVDIVESAERGVANARRVNSEYHFVDATGIGAGVVPVMRGKGVRQAVAIKTAKSPTAQPEEIGGEFKIVRDQIAWACREWLRLDPTAMLPDDDRLEDQLLAHTYQVAGGKLRVRPKADIKEDLLESPDLADGLFLTFAEPEMDDDPPMPAPKVPVRGATMGAKKGDRKKGRRRRRGGGVGGGLSGKVPDD